MRAFIPDHVKELRKHLAEQESVLAEQAYQQKTEKRREFERSMREAEEFYQNSNIAKRENNRKQYTTFCENLASSMLESALLAIYEKCVTVPKVALDASTVAFANNMISSYIKNEGAYNILDRMETTSNLLSELALTINEKLNEILENVDSSDPSTFHVDSKEQINLYDHISGSEDVEDIADLIKMRVSRATEDFMQKNIEDNDSIKDIMYDTKMKIESIRTGNEEQDIAIAKEQTNIMRRAIRDKANRPHNILEQMIINLTESIIVDEDLKKTFTLESGSLNMDSIVEKATAAYTLHEMLTTIKLEKLDEAYLEKMVKMQ